MAKTKQQRTDDDGLEIASNACEAFAWYQMRVGGWSQKQVSRWFSCRSRYRTGLREGAGRQHNFHLEAVKQMLDATTAHTCERVCNRLFIDSLKCKATAHLKRHTLAPTKMRGIELPR